MNMYEMLPFRRQFLLSRNPLPLLTHWECLQVDQYCLQSHPDLEVRLVTDRDKRIVLIGSIFDPTKPEKGNAEILDDILFSINNLKSLFLWIKRYVGIYALLYKDEDETIIFHDALALREIYYSVKENQIICGSQPNLLIKYAEPEIGPRTDPDFVEYYEDHSNNSRWNPYCKWIGDETYYDGIHHLLPNHYFDIKRYSVQRYWPNEPINKLDLEDAVSKACSFIQGSIRAVANRHSIMMAVTAGTDSRTLLAASRSIQDKIYFFINDQRQDPNHPDISIPKAIFENMGIPFHIHDVPKDVNDEFRQIFLSNTFFASERILPAIYNVYFKSHSDKVNVLGIGEIGRTRFGREPKKLDGYRIAYKMKYKKDRYAIKQGEKILLELLPVGHKFNINVLTLLYWEHWLGNWGATGNSESDIAIEEIDPYDSHYLYEIFLAVDNKHADYYKPAIFREMIRKMWPELMIWPINPPYRVQDKIGKYLKKAGMYPLLKEMKYRIYHAKYRPKKQACK